MQFGVYTLIVRKLLSITISEPPCRRLKIGIIEQMSSPGGEPPCRRLRIGLEESNLKLLG